MSHAPALPLLLARKALSLGSRAALMRARTAGRFAGRPVLDAQRGNDHIAALIRSGRPMMVSRLGSSELGAWRALHGARAQVRRGWPRYSSIVRGEPPGWTAEIVHALCTNAGFFPATVDSLTRYAEALEPWVRAADVMAVWFYRAEDKLLLKSQAALVRPMALEAYEHPDPWTLALGGRRVLVVHPFAQSIAAQYPHRDRVFAGKVVLPSFELLTLPAVQSIAGSGTPYPDWFAALDAMKEQIARTEFDIAIIGAGAYGMPLASFVKSLGKQAVHMGGSTQILFGIKGRRWESRPEITRFFNEHWVRPSADETPPSAQAVEDGCYW